MRLLYAGWLGAQLRWTPRSALAKIHLAACKTSDATATGLLSIDLTAGRSTIRVAKNPGELTASVQINLPRVCPLPRKLAFWPTDDASLLSKQLDEAAPDTVYPWALAMAAGLTGLLPQE